jgi:Rieske Fe-S protein
VVESADGLPFIGETSERQFVATGYAGNGLTFGTLAGLMAHDAALGIANPWRELFRPDRKAAGALGTLLAENVDYPYHFIADRLRRLPRSAHDLRAGEGALIRRNGTRVAAFRRSDGRLVQLNPSCTHMGCLVRWNATETTWDCPCHGSRFSAEGEVIGGPAEEPLAPIAD